MEVEVEVEVTAAVVAAVVVEVVVAVNIGSGGWSQCIGGGWWWLPLSPLTMLLVEVPVVVLT